MSVVITLGLWRHVTSWPGAGNNIIVKFFFVCGRLYLRQKRNFRHSVTIRTLWEEDLCHIYSSTRDDCLLCYYLFSCKVAFFHLWIAPQIAILKLEHLKDYLLFHNSLWFIFLNSKIMGFVRELFKKSKFLYFFKFIWKRIRYLKNKPQGFVKVQISNQMQKKRNVLHSKLRPVKPLWKYQNFKFFQNKNKSKTMRRNKKNLNKKVLKSLFTSLYQI